MAKRLWIIAGAVVVSLCLVAGATLLHLGSQPQVLGSHTYTFASTRDPAFPEERSPGLPVLLEIPNINVDAAVESVGVTSQGALGVPENPTDAAWFNVGSHPGATGDAVIDGHIGWFKDGAAAVFDNLYKLRKGDEVYVEDAQGTTTTFIVTGTKKYDPSADASAVFDANDGKAHLNLITCDGTWSSVTQSYSERLVVFTDEEQEQ